MDPQKLQSFLEKAEDRLAGIRGSLLLFAQGRLAASELTQGHRKLEELRAEAESIGLNEVARIAGECSSSVELLIAVNAGSLETVVNRSLDALSRLEAELLQMPLGSDAFLSDVSDLVDASFEHFQSHEIDGSDEWGSEDFEVDDETREIFRSEAEELLAKITSNLSVLANSPDDSNALWEIRRNAHTFKGAAGIIGFHEASELAHRIEDLLDKMVESRCGADGRLIDLLTKSTARLDEMTAGKLINEDPRIAAALSADFDKLIESIPAAPPENGTKSTLQPESFVRQNRPDVAAPTTPVVRVSLDRLDELLKLSRSLLVNRSALAERFTEFKDDASHSFDKLESLIETQRRLSDEMLQRLLLIRMVRFGTLEMRLNRAVHTTCLEENKKAEVIIENAGLEIDTLIIDALIEPLLHLLKNSVVHGIEPPETRRLLGKPEKGLICISVNTDKDFVSMSVEDDGRGISSSKLIEKAVANNLIEVEKARLMDEQSIYQLIFERGLTTADSLNLNAGRGVGMSIVKESVESKGGSVRVDSEQQRGTKFTLQIPKSLPTKHVSEPAASPDIELPPLILIVDDSQSIRRMTANIIEEAGFRTITAEDGAEALELLLNGEWEPDLILSDVEMPMMDGWAFLEYLKTDDNFGHIPVIMVTSLDTDAYREKAFGLGASDYLVKPFSVSDLEKLCGILANAAAA